jgi:hypothetical protein
VDRYERDAQPGDDRLLDAFRVVHLHGGRERDTGVLQRALRHLTRRGAFLSHQQRQFRDGGRRDLEALREGVGRRCDQHELVDESRRQALLGGAEHMATYDTEVEFVPADPFLDPS